jgi:isoleucyl-tRNA synthetase
MSKKQKKSGHQKNNQTNNQKNYPGGAGQHPQQGPQAPGRDLKTPDIASDSFMVKPEPARPAGAPEAQAPVETPVVTPEKTRDFKDTLSLPRTEFSLRADAAINDPRMLQRWELERLAEHAQSVHAGAEQFILPDGPPYANGHIHLGHAYNKILKDIVAKAHRMMGYHTPVIPGWDCHGLPIEHKVSQDHPGLQGAALTTACREYACKWIAVQRDEFKKLGVLMDWERPYLTMNYSYEASVLRVFADLVETGYIERKNKTISWCHSCQTALASAEIEYEDRKDPSLYVLFKLSDRDTKRLVPQLAKPVFVVIWTTTPWTLPLNRAVLMRADAQYQLVKRGDRYLLMGSERVASIMALCDAENVQDWRLVETFKAQEFAGCSLQHPFDSERLVPIILDQSVGLDEGSACVHCAPGCGPSDYETGVKNGLEIYSPLTPDGRYDTGIIPAALAGMSIADAQGWVIRMLMEQGLLLHKGSIRHSYPHCWRCHNGIMFRATTQWFCNLNNRDTKAKTLDMLDTITFIPAQGKNFLRATIENRWEWCLSRQRSWGVPIPALIAHDSKTAFVDPSFMRRVADAVEQHGTEFWTVTPLEELVAQGLLPESFPVHEYRKEKDILDVWFESGVSQYAVLRRDPRASFPADLYLEGLDQHRGWFQSSLLISMMLTGEPPMRAIMTHGFTVDEQGRKMSKSLGNVMAPQQIIDRVGTDGLRLWVASIGNEGDAIVSDRLLSNIEQVYRKIRNTCRFLLQNLYDFDSARDLVPHHDLTPFDRYALVQLQRLQERVLAEYRSCNVTAIFHLLGDYCSGELSSLYADIVKDRLYCDKHNSAVRRSTQTAFWTILDSLTRLIAPILSFTAEQVADYYQGAGHPSIHLQKFAEWGDGRDLPILLAGVPAEKFDADWKLLKEVRTAVLKGVEELRAQGLVKHPLEAAITLSYPMLDTITVVDDMHEFLKMFLIASVVELVPGNAGLQPTALEGLFIRVDRAVGTKCPRCWQWGTYEQSEGLCPRCVAAIS